jgi:hypothetical protein
MAGPVAALLAARLLACAATASSGATEAADAASPQDDARAARDSTPPDAAAAFADAAADAADAADGGQDAAAGVPIALATVLAKHTAIPGAPGVCVVDGQRAFVYVDGSPNGGVVSMDLPTGAPIQRVDITPNGFAVHAGTLYMGRFNGILTAPTSGGPVTTLAGPAAWTFNFLAWDEARQVFVWAANAAAVERFGTMAADGTAFTELASVTPGPNLYPGGQPRQEVVAYDGTYVFYRDQDASGGSTSLVRLDLFGTQAKLLLATGNRAFTADKTSVIFTSFVPPVNNIGQRQVNRVPTDGGAGTTLATLPLTNLSISESTPLADDTYVYASAGSDLVRVPLAGGNPEIILRANANANVVYPLCQTPSYLLVGATGLTRAIYVLAK